MKPLPQQVEARTAEPLVRVRAVRKAFPTPTGTPVVAVDGVSFEIETGAVIALTGPSGSGKSTLLHMIGAIEGCDEGTIEVAGRQVSGLSSAAAAGYRRQIGLVFQRFHLLPTLTALDNVIVPVLPFRTDFDKHARALELLELVGLPDKAATLPSRMSGGQQQRVAIARALINRPSLLLADEPTGNLDSHNSAAVMDLLLRLRAQADTTIVIATHDASIAQRCDHILRLEDGRLVDADRPGTIRQAGGPPHRPTGGCPG